MHSSLRRLTQAAIATLILATGGAHAADAQLLAAARTAEPAVIQSLKEMVSIESGSANAAGLAQMASYTEGRLAALGARTERIAVTKGPGIMVKGTLTGTGKRRIMLIAHMDTVYPANILATQPIKQDGNRLYGPGIADDKGGIAVILHSLAILKAAGWNDYAELTVLFNPDEEVGSIGSGETIAKLADQHDVVLSFEPTAAKAVVKTEALLMGASGTATAVMAVQGRASHAGAAPELGRNALIEPGLPVAANARRGQIRAGHPAQLDHRAGRRGPQPDPRARHRHRRRAHHGQGRRRQAAGRAAKEGGRRQARPRHANHRDHGNRPAAVCRQRARP